MLGDLSMTSLVSVGDMVTCLFEDESSRRMGRVLSIEDRQGFFWVYKIQDISGREWYIREPKDLPEDRKNLRIVENSLSFIMRD